MDVISNTSFSTGGFGNWSGADNSTPNIAALEQQIKDLLLQLMQGFGQSLKGDSVDGVSGASGGCMPQSRISDFSSDDLSPTASATPSVSAATSTPATTTLAATTTPTATSDASTGSSTSSTSTLPSSSSSDPAKAIASDLESRYGLNATQAAGVLGNLQQESNLESDVNQGGVEGAPSSNFADDNGNGWGIAQWGGTRKQAEIDYADKNNLDPGSLQANIGFINQELDGSYSNTISDLKNTTSVDDAAKVWDEDYEQATDPQMANRDQYAENFQSEGL